MTTTGFFIAAGHLRDRARTWPSVEGRFALLKMARELEEMAQAEADRQFQANVVLVDQCARLLADVWPTPAGTGDQ